MGVFPDCEPRGASVVGDEGDALEFRGRERRWVLEREREGGFVDDGDMEATRRNKKGKKIITYHIRAYAGLEIIFKIEFKPHLKRGTNLFFFFFFFFGFYSSLKYFKISSCVFLFNTN